MHKKTQVLPNNLVVFVSLTNVFLRDTIGTPLRKEVSTMAAMNYANSASSNCSTAAVVSSARYAPILDTAILLAVSIFVLSILRIMGLCA